MTTTREMHSEDETLNVLTNLRKVVEKRISRRLCMNSYRRSFKKNDDIVDVDDFEKLEDEMLRKKKIRINSKYSEKRWIP